MKSIFKYKDIIKKLEKSAEIIQINHDSKLVFMSDMHRGNGGYTDSLRENRNIYKAAIKYYLNNEYTLIELGDGDELWKNNNLVDIAYNYNDIFELLCEFNNKNKLYLVFGNHDIMKSNEKFIMKQEKIFKNIGDNYGIHMLNLYKNIEFYEAILLKYSEFKEDEILAFHGHQVDYMNSKLWRLSRFLVRYIWKPIENILGFKEPISPSSNHDKGTKIDLLLDKMAKEERKIIICGHTHNDIFEYPKEGLYFNDGCCIFPHAITAIEIQNGMISLVKWKIEIDDFNYLFVKKEIIGGPERIIHYFRVHEKKE